MWSWMMKAFLLLLVVFMNVSCKPLSNSFNKAELICDLRPGSDDVVIKVSSSSQSQSRNIDVELVRKSGSIESRQLNGKSCIAVERSEYSQILLRDESQQVSLNRDLDSFNSAINIVTLEFHPFFALHDSCGIGVQDLPSFENMRFLKIEGVPHGQRLSILAEDLSSSSVFKLRAVMKNCFLLPADHEFDYLKVLRDQKSFFVHHSKLAQVNPYLAKLSLEPFNIDDICDTSMDLEPSLMKSMQAVMETYGYEACSEAMDYLASTPFFSLPPGFSDLRVLTNSRKLEVLEINDNETLDLSYLQELPSLHSLSLHGQQMRSIWPLESLAQLKVLRINDARQLRSLVPLAKSQLLEELDIRGSSRIISLEPLKGLPLKSLAIPLRNEPAEILGLDKLVNLESLTISVRDVAISYSGLEPQSIKDLAHLNRLKSLNIKGYTASDLSYISHMLQLEKLEIRDNPQLYEIEALSGLQNLKTLIIGNSNRLSDLSVLTNLHHLEKLLLTDLSNLQEIPDLPISLKELLLSRLPISNLDHLGELSKLDVLGLGILPNLDRIDFVPMLPAEMDSFYLFSCPRLKDLSPLASLGDELNLVLQELEPAPSPVYCPTDQGPKNLRYFCENYLDRQTGEDLPSQILEQELLEITINGKNIK